MVEERRTLRELLQRARASITPAEAGLPVRGGRRLRGLRRDEVAELVGISEVWYTRLEVGRARGSLRLLARIADVLRLDDETRALLLSSGRPELVALTPRSTESVLPVGTGGGPRAVRRLLEALQAATDRDEIVAHALRAVTEIARPTSLAYFVDQIDDDGSARFTATEGPAGDAMYGLWQPAAAAVHEADLMRAARISSCEELRTSQSDVYRERVGRFGTRSYCSFGVTAAGGAWWTALGFANTAPGRFDPEIVELLAICAQATRWALTASGDAARATATLP